MVDFFGGELGMRVLGNEHAEHEHGRSPGFTTCTPRDTSRRTPAIRRRRPRSARGLRVLLAHQPRSAAAAAKTGLYDLQLSGHTHGGQYAPFP